MPRNKTYFNTPSEGVPTTKASSLEPFGVNGEPKPLNQEAMSSWESDAPGQGPGDADSEPGMPEGPDSPDGALSEFAPLKAGGGFSSITSHQTVTIPSEGG